MRVAYFINQHPAVSHTFMRREICAIESLGVTVFRYALRPGANLVDLEDKKEKEQTRYVLRAGAGEMLLCCLTTLLSRPLTTIRVIIRAVRIGWRSDRGVLRHLAYVAEAAVLARWCRRIPYSISTRTLAPIRLQLRWWLRNFREFPIASQSMAPKSSSNGRISGCPRQFDIAPLWRALVHMRVVSLFVCWTGVLAQDKDRTLWIGVHDFAETKAPSDPPRRFVCVVRWLRKKDSCC